MPCPEQEPKRLHTPSGLLSVHAPDMEYFDLARNQDCLSNDLDDFFPYDRAWARSGCESFRFQKRLYIRLKSPNRSEEHTSELQSLMRISYAVFCLKKKNTQIMQQSIKNT